MFVGDRTTASTSLAGAVAVVLTHDGSTLRNPTTLTFDLSTAESTHVEIPP